MYKIMQAEKPICKPQNEIPTQITLVQRSVLAKVYDRRLLNFKNRCLHVKTGVEFPSKSVPSFLTVLKFSVNFHAVHDNVITAKYNKTRKKPEKRFSVSFQYKKNKHEKFI